MSSPRARQTQKPGQVLPSLTLGLNSKSLNGAEKTEATSTTEQKALDKTNSGGSPMVVVNYDKSHPGNGNSSEDGNDRCVDGKEEKEEEEEEGNNSSMAGDHETFNNPNDESATGSRERAYAFLSYDPPTQKLVPRGKAIYKSRGQVAFCLQDPSQSGSPPLKRHQSQASSSSSPLFNQQTFQPSHPSHLLYHRFPTSGSHGDIAHSSPLQVSSPSSTYDLSPRVMMRFTLQSFVVRWHHNTPVYSAYWDNEAQEIALEIDGQLLLDCSPASVWDEVLLVAIKRKEGTSSWKIVEQVKHSFNIPYVIKVSKKEKGGKNSLWYQYQVTKIDTGALLAITPPIRPKTARTINDKFVKSCKAPLKDFILNCFELSFNGVSPSFIASRDPVHYQDNNRSGGIRINNTNMKLFGEEEEGQACHLERKDTANEKRRSMTGPIPPQLSWSDKRTMTYPLAQEHAEISSSSSSHASSASNLQSSFSFRQSSATTTADSNSASIGSGATNSCCPAFRWLKLCGAGAGGAQTVFSSPATMRLHQP